VIAIDTVPERLALAKESGAITLDFMQEDIYDRIQELTQGRGADACIDAVGTEPATGSGFDAVVDRIKVATFMGTDRPHVLRQAIHCCRNFGTVSIVGVYGGLLDNMPMGSAINRGLTFRMAQTPVQHYLPKLMERIEKGEIDPSFVITHRATLEEGPELYKTFRAKKDGCIAPNTEIYIQPQPENLHMPIDPNDSGNDFIFDGLTEIGLGTVSAAAGETPLGVTGLTDEDALVISPFTLQWKPSPP
jgi:threonine dehydrogenase-like Zn-dependent dehydrogenase